MPSIASPVLVLNAAYEPLSICEARRAITLLVLGKARLEQSHDHFIYREMMWPSVIRLVEYRRFPRPKYVVSRKNILMRDRQTCQYCRRKCKPAELTLDHVHPKSRGGQNTWENIVTACLRCNNRKADRTPEEAEMELFHAPRALTLHSHRSLMRSIGSEDPLWREYLYF